MTSESEVDESAEVGKMGRFFQVEISTETDKSWLTMVVADRFIYSNMSTIDGNNDCMVVNNMLYRWLIMVV